MMTSRGRNI